MAGPYRLDRTLVRVSGPDARAFLQNLLTQDLDKLDSAPVLYSALLSPQGKVITDMFLWAEPDGGVLIDVDPTRSGDLLRRLSMYKLRAQVALEDVTETHRVLCVVAGSIQGGLPDPRFPLGELGWRAVMGKHPEYEACPDGADTLRCKQIMLGVPDLARDAESEEVFALEGLLDELNGVAFHKGCFVGQENVSRMKRRATTRKKFCPIVFDGAAPAYGAPLLAGDTEIGSVRSGMQGRAIALLRLDRALEAPEALTVGSLAVRLDPPPWLSPASGA
jgi:folate-binding protein YgfZ